MADVPIALEAVFYVIMTGDAAWRDYVSEQKRSRRKHGRGYSIELLHWLSSVWRNDVDISN